jgi:hypothetical protein
MPWQNETVVMAPVLRVVMTTEVGVAAAER